MKTILNPFPIRTIGTSTVRSPIRILALNADNICATKSRQTCTSLIPEFGHSCEFDYSWWSFQELTAEPEFKAAMKTARAADVIVVAGRSDEELPAITRACLEMALAEKGLNVRVLIALIEVAPIPNQVTSATMDRYLRRIAQSAGLEYLAEWFEPGTAALSPMLSKEPVPKPHASFGPFEEPSHPGDFREWGINE